MQLVGAPQTYHPRAVRDGGGASGRHRRGCWPWLRWRWRFWSFAGRYLVPLAAALNLSSVRFLSLELCLLLVAGGMLVGCLGGLVAASGRTA